MNKLSTIKIVDSTVDLWPLYKEIRLRGLKEDPEAFGSSYEGEITFPEEKWKERAGNVFNTLAINESIPVGTMSAYLSEEGDRKIANIVGVFVAKEVRGKKVGTGLMTRVIEKISSTPGISAIRLDVNIDQLPAVKLYEKFGFKKISEKLETMGNGEVHTEMTMERKTH